jgi:hypothetical protein
MTTRNINSFEDLANAIQNTNIIFPEQAQRQINIALTLGNWAIGYYFKQFYLAYPQMIKSASEFTQLNDYQINIIFQSVTEKFTGLPALSYGKLLNKLSFTYSVELAI